MVADIEQAVADFQKLRAQPYTVSEITDIQSQKVKVCFIKSGQEPAIEFVEPYLENKRLQKMLAKGISFYHSGFESTTYDGDCERLVKNGYKKMADFKSEAFGGSRCCFFLSITGQLIELIELK